MYLKWSHPILWPWEASDLLLAQRLVQEEDELPTFVNIHPECAAFFANRSALFMRVFAQKKGLHATRTIIDQVPIFSSAPL